MLSVLKQEFSIHKKNIFFTSIIITAIYAISLICLWLNNVITSENMADFTAIWVSEPEQERAGRSRNGRHPPAEQDRRCPR